MRNNMFSPFSENLAPLIELFDNSDPFDNKVFILLLFGTILS